MGSSESDDWAETDAEVVVGAMVEIDFVAGFQSQTHRAQGRFDSCCGINCGVQARGAEADEGTGQIAVGEQSGAQAEIYEASFESCKWTESAAGGLDFRTDETLCHADRRARDRNDVTVGDVEVGFVEVDSVVVSQFAFQNDVAMDAVAEACAESEIVGAGLRDAEVVEDYTGFDFLGEGRSCEQQKREDDWT